MPDKSRPSQRRYPRELRERAVRMVVETAEVERLDYGHVARPNIVSVLATSVLDSVVAELNDAWAQSSMIDPPSRRYPGFGLDDGYYVGACILREQIAAGRVASGKKLGFTNQAVWAQVGLDQPFWAPIYRDSLRRTAEVDVTGIVQPRIEPEIVLALKRDLSDPDLSVAEILSAVEWCALGFEIVGCHYAGWSFAPADAIADRGLHAALIVGEPTRFHSAQEDMLAALTVTLFLNGAPRAAGRAANVLGSPALALRWLLKILAGTGEHGIRAGEVITTGSLTDAPQVETGELWHLEAQGSLPLPSLSIRLSHPMAL